MFSFLCQVSLPFYTIGLEVKMKKIAIAVNVPCKWPAVLSVNTLLGLLVLQLAQNTSCNCMAKFH